MQMRTANLKVKSNYVGSREKADLNPSEMKGFIMISRDLDRLTENDIERLVGQHELMRCNYET